MISWSSKHNAFITFLFIAFFMGALTITALCDLEIIDYSSNLSHHHEEPAISNVDYPQFEQNHVHSHGDHGASQGQTPNNHHSGNDEDECCDDAASILASSLFSSIVEFTVPVAKFFLAGIIEFKPQISSQYQSDNIIYHEYDDPPPLNGFKLRVEIQSFLN